MQQTMIAQHKLQIVWTMRPEMMTMCLVCCCYRSEEGVIRLGTRATIVFVFFVWRCSAVRRAAFLFLVSIVIVTLLFLPYTAVSTASLV